MEAVYSARQPLTIAPKAFVEDGSDGQHVMGFPKFKGGKGPKCEM